MIIWLCNHNQKLNSTICYRRIVIVERERSKIISLKLCLSWTTPPISLNSQFRVTPPLLSLLITLAALHIDTFLLFFYAYYLQFLYFFYLILSFWSDITYCVPSPQISLNYHSRSHPPHPYWWVIWLRFLNAPRTVKPSIVGQSCTADFISRKLIIQYNLVNIEFM